MAGESSLSSERRRAAAARKSVLAKFDDLPGKLAIRSGGFRLARVNGDGSTDEGCLAELHGVADDRVEDVVIADDPQLIEHVAGEVRTAVVEGREEAEDLQATVQLEVDRVDDLDEVREALHGVVLRMHGDDDAVRSQEAVDGERAGVWL